MRRLNVEVPLCDGVNPAGGGAMAREYQCVNFPFVDHADFQIGAEWRD
jgi:hypothetical protein